MLEGVHGEEVFCKHEYRAVKGLASFPDQGFAA